MTSPLASAIRVSTLFALIAATTLATSGTVEAAPFKDHMVQAPSLAAPERGSVAGTLASLAFEPGSLARGGFSMPAPMSAPSDRGDLLASVFPTYAPDAGQSEWGMGWKVELSIQRFAVVGDLDFTAEEFISPWGRLVKGSDGWFYPMGFSEQVALQRTGDGGWQAVSGEGTTYTFAGADAVAPEYAWMLSRVETVTGDRTVLTYERNASGRPFVKTVEWGGRGELRQYRLELGYEALAVELDDFRSGARLVLDRRVREARVLVRSAGSGAFETRWTYRLDHTTSPASVAFYLTGVTKTYRSGASEPTQQYEYDLGTATIAQATLVDVPELDAAILAYGATVLQPDKATMLDLDEDGLLDVEVARDQTLLRQSASGFTIEALPAAPGASALCRPPVNDANAPRSLARMTAEATEPQVVRAFQEGLTGKTRVIICNRAGVPLFNQLISGYWALNATTHLVDVNRDHRPDIVRVFSKGYQVLENVSTPAGYAFAVRPAGVLAPTIIPEASWLHDMNGDGLPDLVVRYSAGIAVWHGLGNFKFVKNVRTLPLRAVSGVTLTDVATRELSFPDVNRDGLTDVLTTQGHVLNLFVNDGKRLQEVPIPGLGEMDWNFGSAVVADVTGDGNVEIVFVQDARARAIQLSAPGTGLLRAAHDNQGTHVSLRYERATPAPLLGARAPLLAELEVASSGQEPVSTQYEYAQPVMHTRGKFLVGFTTARRLSPFLMEEVTFHHDDDLTGRVVGTLASDARSSFYRFTSAEVEESTYLGVRLLRDRRNTTGLRSLDGSETIAQSSEILAYERGTCPAQARTTNEHGALETENALAVVAGLDSRLHCLPASQRLTGVHPDASLDFQYLASITRNEVGQVTQILQLGTDGMQPVQTVTYDGDHRVASITSPGSAPTTFSYHPTTGLLVAVVDPNGVTTRSNQTDPVTDAMHEMGLDHGPGGLLTASYRFDGHERLWKQWDDHGVANETNPEVVVEYAYARDDGPAVVRSRELVTAGVHHESATLSTAAGETVATLSRVPTGWTVGTVLRQDASTREARRSYRAPLGHTDPGAVTWSQLMTGADALGVERTAGFGHVIHTADAVQLGVHRTVEQDAVLEDGVLVTTTVENHTTTVTTATDLAGSPRWTIDATGQATHMAYDALARLRRVELPDGSVHQLSLDSYGRPSQVERVGQSVVRYDYDPASGLMSTKTVLAGDGTVERTSTWTRDAAGRVVTEQHRKAATGQTRTFQSRYDGDSAGQPRLPGQLGRLTEIQGDGYAKRTIFDRNGAQLEHRVRLDGFRDVVEEWTYYENGAPRDVTTIVRDDLGNELYRITQTDVYDAHGRLAEVRVDGAPFARTIHDAEGRVERIEFADGRVITHHHDPLTRSLSGYWQDGGGWNSGVDWTLDARGKVVGEAISFGDQTWNRSYEYDARGFLTRAKDQDQDSRYEYAAGSGRVKRITDLAGDRLFLSVGSHTQAGGLHYRRDPLGRVVERGDLSMEYGPTGDLEVARRGGRTWSFVHDESGQRVLKREGGLVRAGYVGGMFLEEQRMVLPVRLGGRIVGVFELTSAGKRFEPLATDPRGTLLGEHGTPNLPTPYGVRATRPDLAPALDYVEKAFDADLGTVRMGVRDYDPFTGEFLTPDPLFMEDIELVAQRPVAGNLFTYASNDPVGRIDPKGTFDDPNGLFDTAKKVAPAAPVVVTTGKVVLIEGAALLGGKALLIAGGGVVVVGAVVVVVVYYKYRRPIPRQMDPVPTSDGPPPVRWKAPRETPRLDTKPQPDPKTKKDKDADTTTRTRPPDDDDDDGGIYVYRAGPNSAMNMTPRTPNDDAGLSTFDTPEAAFFHSPNATKVQKINLLKLTLLHPEPDDDPPGHVSIKPADADKMREWQATRGGSVPHLYTLELQGAVEGEIPRPKP